MGTEILLNRGPNEVRVAVLEDKQLAELYVERADLTRTVGDIHKGKITSVRRSLRAAFVDIGMAKQSFLPLSEAGYEILDYEEMAPRPKEAEGISPVRELSKALKVGQEILVQIAKEPMGTKGARVTSFLSIPGRYLVLMPGLDHVGVSRRIEEREERKRLRELCTKVRPEGYGLIVRTAALGFGEGDLRRDIRSLLRIWERIKRISERSKAPCLVHKDAELVVRLVRDIFSTKVDRLIVDSKDQHRRITSYLKSLSPRLTSRVSLYDGETPLFDAYGVERQIDRMFSRKVSLKAGGYICIDQTEALVAIDVNSGRYSKEQDPEKMSLAINLEAAKEIARQLRLRDIGGIIVIDFIDMKSPQDRRRVVRELRKALKKDKSKTDTLKISEFGLVEMTRERVRPPLIQTFYEPCPVCKGGGRVLSKASLATKVEKWLEKHAPALSQKHIQIRASPSVADHLSLEEVDFLSRISRQHRVRIEIKGDPSLSVDELRIFRLDTNEEISGGLANPAN